MMVTTLTARPSITYRQKQRNAFDVQLNIHYFKVKKGLLDRCMVTTQYTFHRKLVVTLRVPTIEVTQQ